VVIRVVDGVTFGVLSREGHDGRDTHRRRIGQGAVGKQGCTLFHHNLHCAITTNQGLPASRTPKNKAAKGEGERDEENDRGL